MAPPDPITCEELIVACQFALDSFQFKYNIILKKNKKKRHRNSKYRQTGTGRECVGTTNPRGTWTPDNTLKGIYNQIPRDPDNTLKRIQNQEPNRIWSQWLRGLTIQT